MKVLVAEDDPTSRRWLEVALSKWGYDVVLASNGKKAWDALQDENPPSLVLLDWMMPKMSGTDICRKLRGTNRKTYTYVIMVTAKSSKEDVIAGLEAGADDFIPKPVNLQELRARLRAAERVLRLQGELQQRIEEMESLLRRHNLLRDVLNKQTQSSGTAEADEPATQKPAVIGKGGAAQTEAVSGEVSEVGLMARVDDIVMKSFRQLGLGSAEPKDPSTLPNGENWEFTAWSVLILMEAAQWIDLKVEMDRDSAKTLLQTALGNKAGSDDDLLDVVGEMLNIIQGQCKALCDEEGVDVAIPVVPKAILKENLPPLPRSGKKSVCRGYSLPGMTVRFTLMSSPSPVVKGATYEVSATDLLAEPLQSSDRQADILLNKGIMLDDHYLEKVRDLAKSEEQENLLSVIRSSPLTKAIFAR